MSFEYSNYPLENYSFKLAGRNSALKVKVDNVASTKLYEMNTIPEIEKLKEDWKKLFLNSPGATPFQSWEWNYAIIKRFSSSEKIKIIVGYNGSNEVVGIASFKITHLKFTGIKILEFIGNKHSDYLDFLVDEDYKHTFITALFGLIKSSENWTILNLTNLREETGYLIAHVLPVEIFMQDVCPCVNLPGQ